jgi:hypothetical protein
MWLFDDWRYAVKVRDKNVKQLVDVSDKECQKRECYWPRPDPGVFTQGVGYRTRYPGREPDWLCGNREIRGCPAKYRHTSNSGERLTAETEEADGMTRNDEVMG